MMKKTLCALALIGAAATAHADLVQNFDNVSTLASQGFTLRNSSAPAGVTGWYQGDASIFSAQAGADNSYVAANYNNAAGGGTIDNWLISSQFSTERNSLISFWVRGAADPNFFDTMSFGMSNGGDAAVDFSLVPTFTVPTGDWTEYQMMFAGTGASTVGRFAIRYTGAADSANYIGVDSLAVTVPEPTTPLMLGIGALGMLIARRRKAQQ
jgi:hypothetical protein